MGKKKTESRIKEFDPVIYPTRLWAANYIDDVLRGRV